MPATSIDLSPPNRDICRRARGPVGTGTELSRAQHQQHVHLAFLIGQLRLLGAGREMHEIAVLGGRVERPVGCIAYVGGGQARNGFDPQITELEVLLIT